MKKLFTLRILCFLFPLMVGNVFAADYYWVGGSGNWTDLSHWSSTPSGSGGAYSVTPQTTDNVFFTQFSGFTSTNRTVTLNGLSTDPSLKTNNFTVRMDIENILPAGSPLIFVGVRRMDVYGDFIFETNRVRCSGPDNASSWTGRLSFFTGGDLLTTISTKGVELRNNLIYFERDSPSVGNFVVTDEFRHASTTDIAQHLVVNFGNSASSLTFQESFYYTGGVDIIHGVVNVQKDFSYLQTLQPPTRYIRVGNQLDNAGNTANSVFNHTGTGDSYAVTFAQKGNTYFSPGAVYNFAVLNNTLLDSEYIPAAGSNRIFVIDNTTINISNYWSYGTLVAAHIGTFSGVGSVVNFTNNSTSMRQSSLHMNVVNVYSQNVFEWNANYESTHTNLQRA